MGDLKFDDKDWEKWEQLKACVIKKLENNLQYDQWDYLMDVNETFKDYDPDASEYVWNKVYKKIYKEWDFWKKFDMEHLWCANHRLYAKVSTNITNEEWKDFFEKENKNRKKYRFSDIEAKAKIWENLADEEMIRISGETDFNFKKGCLRLQNQKYEYYKEQIGNNEESLHKLEWCEKRFHSLENFSIMFVPGAMNNLKARSRDRIDIFINTLDRYFKKRNEQWEEIQQNKILQEEAWAQVQVHLAVSGKEEYRKKCKQALYEYLSLFENIEDYCYKIYGMDQDIVEKLIKLGAKKKEYFDGSDVEEFMNLAEMYWARKHNLIFHP